MAFPKPIVLSSDGRTIRIKHPQLPGEPKTLLTAAVTATGTTLTVTDTSGFSDTEMLLLGTRGSDRAESIQVNGAVSRGTSMTTTATVFDHPIDTPVERIHFDQWRIYGNSTDTTVAATLIDTIDIKWDEDATTYTNAGTEYNYYYVLGYDSSTTITSTTYSDGIAKDTGWTEGTVGSIIESAFEATGMEREKVSDRWLFKEINDCLRFVTGKLRHWSFLQVFDASLGAVIQGSFSFSMPSDIEDPNSNKSVLGFRVGTGEDMLYIDKEQMEREQDGVARTQVRTEAAAADTTLKVDNSYDFADSGSVDVFVSGTKYTLTYTGVTRSTTAGVLTGVPASGTGAITVTTPVDSYVWQNVEEGTPAKFTIYDGSLYIWPLPDSANDYQNAVMDYYSKKTAVDQYSDSIEGQRYDAVKHWLCWKLRSLNNSDGMPDLSDGDYVFFREILTDIVRQDNSGQSHRFRYKLNSITY